ncbi:MULTISPECIES: type VI secretion system lipoprotein TssJ [Pseudomonas]|uniref:Type VI secretion system lipoprotein TssJ n=1 Tax=Pseudomonas neustonica TaxID=2487346 RepID=A0ABX9XLR8_9PSED|nr:MULTISPECIES: type VI secretion system lipoprotein TssJ [Pseudomonas]MAB25700.1 type VI secretion system lipoprotein TssJ [Pseudomonadales bacterium]MBA6421669.1 type VI secretion system lipoprotein TssJ [Pseudomonas sp. 5Ae-yellow]ROZ83958.1 type VI secretion system lipoprotein TssJ [Pseudomonas sp. SSM44]ROZ85815.1 type VI secretion system lipoprotein TssJ [Pseudomonas neustonica]
MFSSFVNRCLLGLLCALMLSGCSMLSPYSDMTKVDLTLQGSERLNPDINDRPSPIVLQLIELKNPVAFEHADFFSLYQRPREVLAPDLVAMEELELRPGEERTYKLSAQPESRYLAVLAAYRDLPQAQWRIVLPLDSKERNEVELLLDEQGIRKLDSNKDED